jgi:pimeloyl-ACP methyl ester carboxylesterase
VTERNFLRAARLERASLRTARLERVSLRTVDAVQVAAWHLPRADDDRAVGIVLVHGFTLSGTHPAVRRLARRLADRAGVVGVDLRGHGASGGRSTVGSLEVHDLQAAVDWARSLGYHQVATLGCSLGAVVALRHAAECGGVDAVAAVSGPAHWYFRGTTPMRRAHRGFETRTGRAVLRWAWRTRVDAGHWDPTEPGSWPLSPEEAAARVPPTPLLVVHGDADGWFPVEHARRIAAAAGDGAELWVVPGMGHAEAGLLGGDPAVVARLAGWLVDAAAG